VPIFRDVIPDHVVQLQKHGILLVKPVINHVKV
jgi:hypothetical protein